MENSDLIQCPICYITYDHAEHAPRVHQCGNSICTSCIFKIIQQNANVRFICPFCKKPQLLGITGIESMPKNRDLIKILSEFGEQPHLCASHNKPQELICLNDGDIVCVKCLLTNDHKEHELIDVKEFYENVTNKKALFRNKLIEIDSLINREREYIQEALEADKSKLISFVQAKTAELIERLQDQATGLIKQIQLAAAEKKKELNL